MFKGIESGRIHTMTTKYREATEDEIHALMGFIKALTDEEPTLLTSFETAKGRIGFEIPRWSNVFRERYRVFETETSYCWVYSLHAYGVRCNLYISKLPVTVFDLMEDEELIHKFDVSEVEEIDKSIFEQSMIFI